MNTAHHLLPSTSKAHNPAVRSKWSYVIFRQFIGVLVPILLPVVHMGIFHYMWSGEKKSVNHVDCTCSCWDTIFKGPYESGIGKYKHLYFNSTWNVFKIWTLIVIGVVAAYESFKTFTTYVMQRKLRWSMGLLFLSSIFSHYYAWWGVINYYNDDFYSQWYHQVFFTASELITTCLVFYNFDKTQPVSRISLIIIGNIALIHIFLASWDQFVVNVLFRGGKFHQVSRDIGLMSTDILYIYVSVFELFKYSRSTGQTLRSILFSQENFRVLVSVYAIMILAIFLLLHGS